MDSRLPHRLEHVGERIRSSGGNGTDPLARGSVPRVSRLHLSVCISLRGAAIDVSLLRCPPTRRSPAESLDVFLPRFDARGCLASLGEDWSELSDGLFQRPDLAEAIRGLLQRLDDIDRAAFILREIEQFSVEETVAILRIPADEVRARTHRATVLLTGLLGRMRRIPAGSQPSWKA